MCANEILRNRRIEHLIIEGIALNLVRRMVLGYKGKLDGLKNYLLSEIVLG